jgi:TRAP-type C4-dicarboxylate transport system permease small subunit
MVFRVSAKDLYVLHAAVIIILLWVALWNLVEHAISEVENRTQIQRWKLYMGLLVFVLLMIFFDPYIFEKL